MDSRLVTSGISAADGVLLLSGGNEDEEQDGFPIKNVGNEGVCVGKSVG